MTCDEARALFSARADDAITPDEVTRLDTHLGGCAECRAEWARFARTISLVRGIEPARAPVGFVDRVLQAARPEPWPLRLVRHVFMPMRVKLPVEAAAVMLIAGLAVMIFQRSPEAPLKWLDGLEQTIAELNEFPARCALAPESDVVGLEIRHHLYGRRQHKYRILFAIRAQTVHVLHVRHGARDFLFPPELDDID